MEEHLAKLLSRARAGDGQAREDLFKELRILMRQRAGGFLRPAFAARVDASDVAQEVCINLHQAFDQFAGQTVEELLAWAQRTLKNELIDGHRRQHAQARDANREVAGGDLFGGLPADGTTPSQAAVRNEQQQRQQTRLNEALQRLPEKQRLVFQLRFSEGLSFEEVTERACVSVSNARVLMLRATERLRHELGDES